MATSEGSQRRLLLRGGTVGFGLGAIVDVVVFHLVFQHHHLLSGYVGPHTYEGLQANLLYDGLFLLLMLGVTSVGLVLLWGTVNGLDRSLSNRFLGGSVLVGAGAFNVFDGIVDHYVLGLHDVVQGTEAWNPHWVVASLLMLGAGVGLLYWSGGAVRSEPSSVHETD